MVDLVLPSPPLLTSDYDLLHRVAVESPDTSIVDNISVSMAGFPLIASSFYADNQAAYTNAGQGAFPAEDYPMDGYAVMVELDLKDQNGIGVCISKTSDIIVDVADDFTCFALQFDSTQQTPLTRQFTDNLPNTVNFNDESIASQTPNLQQLNQYYNSTCGSGAGLNYNQPGI